MGDGSAIGGWILTAAIITVLATGVGRGPDTPSPQRTPTTDPRNSPTSENALSDSAAGVPACARASRVVSTDGTRYRIVPVAANGNATCRLQPGDRGRAVSLLQQSLLLCSNREVRVDGTFSRDTGSALQRDQARQLAVPPTGIYGPRTAREFRWPWYDRRTNDFTGNCGQLADRTP